LNNLILSLLLKDLLFFLLIQSLLKHCILLCKFYLKLHSGLCFLFFHLLFSQLLLSFYLLLFLEERLMQGFRPLLFLLLESLEFFSGFLSLFLLDENELGLTLFFLHMFDLCLGRVKINCNHIFLNFFIGVIIADDLIFLFDIISDS